MRLRSPLAALVVLVLASCAGPRPAPAGGVVRLATWNLANLFDEVRQGDVPSETVPSAAEVRAKLAALGAGLRALDADVVAVQEAENRAILQRLGAPGYLAFLEEGSDPRGIDVGVLSRFPSGAVPLVHEDAALFPRPPLEVRLAHAGHDVVLVVAHLKSKLGGEPSDARRLAQARRLRAIADDAAARSPDAIVVVAGDLNDGPRSPALAALVGDGEWVDVASFEPMQRAWTFSYRGQRERVDYVLVRSRDSGRVRSVATLPVPPGASDHRPVLVELAL